MENIKKFKEVIHYITSKIPGLSRTQLVKLTYLSDRTFFESENKEITNVENYMYFYGPYCDEFEKALNELKDEKLIHEEFFKEGYKIYHNNILEYNLDIKEKVTIDNVLDLAKKLNLLKSAKKIKDYVYDLPELENIEPLEKIYFKKQYFE